MDNPPEGHGSPRFYSPELGPCICKWCGPLEVVEDHQPIHTAFGLTYASFLVVPRAVLQAMPVEWQRKFVEMMEELNEKFPWESSLKNVDKFLVQGRYNGKFVSLPSGLTDYRRPNLSWIERS